MKTKETKFGSPICLGAHHLFRAAVCLAAVILICSTASAPHLFSTGNDCPPAAVFEYAPDGTRTTFVSGLDGAGAIAFDRAGNLFVADGSTILKITPEGTQTIFASGLDNPYSLVFDRGGNLFVADAGSILRF